MPRPGDEEHKTGWRSPLILHGFEPSRFSPMHANSARTSPPWPRCRHASSVGMAEHLFVGCSGGSEWQSPNGSVLLVFAQGARLKLRRPSMPHNVDAAVAAAVATDAYVYFYPLVTLDVSRRQ